jgi:hypothetical protein
LALVSVGGAIGCDACLASVVVVVVLVVVLVVLVVVDVDDVVVVLVVVLVVVGASVEVVLVGAAVVVVATVVIAASTFGPLSEPPHAASRSAPVSSAAGAPAPAARRLAFAPCIVDIMSGSHRRMPSIA